jgi:dihydroneopterin aldolase
MTATPENVLPLHIADARLHVHHVFVRDLMLDAEIGIHPHEKGHTQKIRVNVDMAVADNDHIDDSSPDSVVCYETLVNKIRRLISAGHVGLVETLAGRVADIGLEDERVLSVRVRIEKLQAIEDTASVGVEIERSRRHPG